MRFIKVYDGDWIQPVKKGYRLRCCDCGLIHTLNFRIKDGQIQLQAFRDDRATNRFRKTNKIKLKRP